MTGITEAAVLSTIKDALRNQPRSLQKRIGPSELGMECEHCLAAKLAGWEQTPEAAWLPAIGTFVHAGLADIFNRHPDRWLVEHEVMVGWVGNAEIWGSSDLFDTETGTVIDFKIVGATTLKKAKTGPSKQYFTQANLYGTGFVNAGHTVTKVAICYLPRNAISLEQGVWWENHHDPAVAAAALENAERLTAQIDLLASIDPAAVDVWIRGLERHPDCYQCARYPDAPAPVLSTVAELVGV